MDFSIILAWLAGIHPMIPVALALLGTLVVLGQALVFITPGKGDDAKLDKLKAMPIVGPLMFAIAKFAPIIFRS